MKKIGFIGYGLRSDTMMKAFRTMQLPIEVAAIADPDVDNILPKVRNDSYFAHVRSFKTAEEMLASTSLDGVFIGTRCSLHTPFACMVLKEKLPLFLEKPVCTSREQYDLLREAGEGQEDHVVVSFPLRMSSITEEMRRLVESGTLGTLQMVQAVNNVPYGSVYFHSWYRDANETGGLFLQKATHDIDYINYLTGEKPVSVCAKTTRLHFTGDKPKELRCPDCPEYRTCHESSFYVANVLKEDVQGDMCCFTNEAGNEDGASMILTTQRGMLISYNQNFTVKKSAARRGCRLVGDQGSAEFDFNTGIIREDRYDVPETITHTFHFSGNHFGGDEGLALAFYDVLNGKPTDANLTAGLNSAAACLAARQADAEGRFVPIIY